MSYRFEVPGGAPDPSLIAACGADKNPLQDGDAPGFIAWRGRTSRGVFVYEEAGMAHFKLPTMASPDDVKLAVELAICHARAREVPISVEDPPDAHDEDKAPAPPPGCEGLFWVRPEELADWPENWHQPHSMAGALAMLDLFKAGGAAALSGPFRRSFMGRGAFRACLGDNQRGNDEFYAALMDYLIGAQREEDATLPVMPRLLGATRLGQHGFFAKLFGKTKLPLPAGAEWSPPPFPTLEPPRCYEGDLNTYKPERRREAHYTVATPGASYLLPQSDYVALRESEDAWFCVPFAAFMEALGQRFRWLDEYTAVVHAPDGEDWDQLTRRLAPASVGHIAHEPQLTKSVQEIVLELEAAMRAGQQAGVRTAT